jgi:hypothetical protein
MVVLASERGHVAAGFESEGERRHFDSGTEEAIVQVFDDSSLAGHMRR